MLKAAVFDDEYIVVQGLQSLIDWAQYGIQLVGTADNGIDALRLFEELRPDIVLTDIRMPGMDGLDLIEEIMKRAPDTVCMVFSGFNEFEYVKRAIKLGVADYLEKPLTIKKIEEAIEKISERVVRNHDILEKATLDLLLAGDAAEPKWRRILGKGSDQVTGVTVLAFSESNEYSEFHPSYRFVPVTNGTDKLAAVFHYEVPNEAFWVPFMEWSRRQAGVIGAGRTYARMSDATASMKEALQALRHGTTSGSTGWIHYDHLQESKKHSSVKEALKYIEENYYRDVNLHEVAEHVGMNVTYFSELFKEEMNLTYIKYLTKIRVEHAKRLLEAGHLVQEVSARVGYYHYRHFTDVFKKYAGISPGQYRESQRRKSCL